MLTTEQHSFQWAKVPFPPRNKYLPGRMFNPVWLKWCWNTRIKLVPCLSFRHKIARQWRVLVTNVPKLYFFMCFLVLHLRRLATSSTLCLAEKVHTQQHTAAFTFHSSAHIILAKKIIVIGSLSLFCCDLAHRSTGLVVYSIFIRMAFWVWVFFVVWNSWPLLVSIEWNSLHLSNSKTATCILKSHARLNGLG